MIADQSTNVFLERQGRGMESEVLSTAFEPKPTREDNGSLPANGEKLEQILPAAWEDLFTAALPIIKAMLRRYLRNEADALEAIQQTALQATASRHQFRAEASLSTWLVSIAINEARQILRKHNRQRATTSLDLLEQEPRDKHHCSPEEEAHKTERKASVRQAVQRLPPIYRTVVQLCEFEECSIEQAAQLLGLTPSAVKSRRFRARRLLARRLLKQHGATPDPIHSLATFSSAS